MQKSIDLNSDLGESFGSYKMGMDDQVLKYVSSANIACGFHAGDPQIMDETVKMAAEKGISIGAHPAYPDLLGFGRRDMDISQEEARAYILYQVGALQAFAQSHGVKINHIKLHGAFYNYVSKDRDLAKEVVQAVLDYDPEITLLCLSGSSYARIGEEMGAKVAHEVFADRVYNEDGSLVSRKLEGAVIHDKDQAAKRVIQMVEEGKVSTISGQEIPIKADSICVHGDNPEAIELVKTIRQALEDKGIEIKAFS